MASTCPPKLKSSSSKVWGRTQVSGWLDASIWVQTIRTSHRGEPSHWTSPPGSIEDWMRAENAHLDADRPWTRATAVVSGEHPFSSNALHVKFLKPDALSPSNARDDHVFEVSGVLFDNDGVLVDSHDVAAKCGTGRRTAAPAFDFHRDVRHGLRIQDAVADIVCDPVNVPEAARDLIDMEFRLATRVGAIRGAPTLASQCPANAWAVVTSGRRAVALARLVSAGLPRPTSIISAEDIDNGKPDPIPTCPAPHRSGCTRIGSRCSRTRLPASRRPVRPVWHA